MTDLFLRAKHWQLFNVGFGVPMVFYVFQMASIIGASLEGGGNSVPVERFFLIFPIVMLAMAGTLLGWFYAVGTGLQKRLPEELRQSTGFFKVAIFVPALYIAAILGFMAVVMNGNIDTTFPGSNFLVLIILVVHLFSMFCMFYILNFVAKTIKTAELQRRVTFSDYVGEGLMIWFFPIGVWMIQPTVNRLINAPVNKPPAEEYV